LLSCSSTPTQHLHVPIELRLAAVALAAGVLLGIGWRLRRSREGYALALQGGGVGLLYLTIFGALRLFGLLPAGPAFALLLAVAALSAVLAVLQDSLALAVLGAAGGFLAPILASSGAGSHVALFGYYACSMPASWRLPGSRPGGCSTCSALHSLSALRRCGEGSTTDPRCMRRRSRFWSCSS
jgi:uncharacterized membrane protein